MLIWKIGPIALNLTPISRDLGRRKLPETVGRVTADRDWHAKRAFWRFYRVTKDRLI